jgi:hypothetical protein
MKRSKAILAYTVTLSSQQVLSWHLHRRVSVNGTLFKEKMRTFKGEYAQFIFIKCPMYTHGGASAKFSTNSQESDNSVGWEMPIAIDHRPSLARTEHAHS